MGVAQLQLIYSARVAVGEGQPAEFSERGSHVKRTIALLFSLVAVDIFDRVIVCDLPPSRYAHTTKTRSSPGITSVINAPAAQSKAPKKLKCCSTARIERRTPLGSQSRMGYGYGLVFQAPSEHVFFSSVKRYPRYPGMPSVQRSVPSGTF